MDGGRAPCARQSKVNKIKFGKYIELLGLYSIPREMNIITSEFDIDHVCSENLRAFSKHVCGNRELKPLNPALYICFSTGVIQYE